ncbi:MAG TPA: PilZ domain-containing protein [Terriglobia bacterium]|nr:PilZ domain-containing protein [Terriglobia bacterium]
MVPTLNSCKKYGDRAALLAMVPGLGHFRNRQYVIGILSASTISMLLVWIWWLAILQFGSQHSNLSEARACFVCWTVVVWLASAFHAYLSTTRRRQENGARRSVDLAVQISLSDLRQPFQTARARNLSKSGACLVVPQEFALNSKLSIQFPRHQARHARVVWSKPTGKGAENLVGVEFAEPLRALEPALTLARAS